MLRLRTVPAVSAPRSVHSRSAARAFLSRDLYALIPAACVDEGLTGRAFPNQVSFLRSGRVAALAGPPVLRLPGRERVRNALCRLRTYHLVLEQVMRRTPVLPARFGTCLPGRRATEALLREHENRLMRALDAYGHLLQLEIRVSGPRVSPGAGARILAAREHIRLELKGLCLAMRDEPAHVNGPLLCVTVLIRPWDEPRLDAALARLDGAFGGWLRFNCVGPLPPCTFLRVSLARSAAAPSGWSLSLASSLPGAAWPACAAPSPQGAAA